MKGKDREAVLTGQVQISPMLMFLTVVTAIAFVATALSFLMLVWQVSWSLQGYLATALRRVKYEERIAGILEEYVETQRQTNEQLWMALQVHADRLNRCSEQRLQEGTGER